LCHKLDPVFFTQLSKLDREDVRARSLCGLDGQGYILPFLIWTYRIDPGRRLIEPLAPGAREVGADLGLLLLFYLLKARDVPLEGRWVSEFDIPGGSLFFRGPHRFRTDDLAEKFGRDLDGFTEASLRLGGASVELGDRAFRFQVLPRVPAAAVLWRADDEFPASAKLLLDGSVKEHLPLDVIFGLSLELLGALVGRPLWT
jgi:Domain of unknown function (DUF3786)